MGRSTIENKDRNWSIVLCFYFKSFFCISLKKANDYCTTIILTAHLESAGGCFLIWFGLVKGCCNPERWLRMEQFWHGIPAQYSSKAAEISDNIHVLVKLFYKRYCLLYSIWRALLEKALTGNTVLDKTKIGMITSATEAPLLGHIEWLHYSCAQRFLSGEWQLLQSLCWLS